MTLFPAPVMVKVLLAKAQGAVHKSASAATPHHFWADLIMFSP
jgi:hypothetical protein